MKPPDLAPRNDAPAVRPARTATLMAGAYLVVAAAYILISSTFASEHSGSVEDLKRLEILKGLAFVAGSALLLFVVNFTTLRRIRRHELQTRRMERAMRNAEHSVLAGTFARSIAHDINNALGIATLNLDQLQTQLAHDPKRRALVDEADRALTRITDWNRRFFEIGGRQLLGDIRDLDLREVIQGTVELARQHGKLQSAQIEVSLPAQARYRGIASIIERAVLNLILNAADAAGETARIVVALSSAGHGSWSISVEDNGPGIAPALREEVLEPFFTTKPDGIGTGLGLAVSRSLARDHGGDLTLEPTAHQGGASFRLNLPISGEPVRESGPVPLQSADVSQARVLVVDDEAEIAGLMRDMLEGAGYEVATAESGAVALALLETARFDAVVSDLHMPEMDGATLWREVAQLHPALSRRMLFVTGDTLSPGASEFLRKVHCPGLDKPFSKTDLLAAVAQLLDSSATD